MKKIFAISIFYILAISQLCCSQTKKLSKGITGYYTFIDSSLLAGASLNLSKDGNYVYKIGTDLQTQHSYGKWSLKGDTLLLTSSIERNNIPVTVYEKRIDSVRGNIVIGLVENLDKEIMDAAFMFNGDTSKLCVPLMETGCDQKIGSIDSFKITFSNETCTPWIKLKDKRTNLIEVRADIHDVLALFLFFRDKKFLYNNGSLKYISSDGGVLKKTANQPPAKPNKSIKKK